MFGEQGAGRIDAYSRWSDKSLAGKEIRVNASPGKLPDDAPTATAQGLLSAAEQGGPRAEESVLPGDAHQHDDNRNARVRNRRSIANHRMVLARFSGSCSVSTTYSETRHSGVSRVSRHVELETLEYLREYFL